MKNKKKAVIVLAHYFKCILKSSDRCPVFYSPSLRENTTDADGGIVVSFVDDATATTARTAPRKIYIPVSDYESLPKFAYVNFDDNAVLAGAPRYLTVEQYESKAPQTVTKSDQPTVSQPAD
jgi:hypothetical protein